jgi:hypothetical protein
LVCCFCYIHYMCAPYPQKYIEHANSIEDLSPYAPLYKVMEGNEPCFFKTYFSWDNTKSVVCSWYLGLFVSAVLSDNNHTGDISRFLLQSYGFCTNFTILNSKFHTLYTGSWKFIPEETLATFWTAFWGKPEIWSWRYKFTYVHIHVFSWLSISDVSKSRTKFRNTNIYSNSTIFTF